MSRWLPNLLPQTVQKHPETEGKLGPGAQTKPKVIQTPCFAEKLPGKARLPSTELHPEPWGVSQQVSPLGGGGWGHADMLCKK